MRLSLQITAHAAPGGPAELRPTLAAMSRAADSAAFAGIAVGDHLWQHPYMGGPEADLLGAGHYPDDMRGLGIAFPPLGDRYEMLEETLRYCLRMWDGEGGDQGTFIGKHYRAERLLNRPQTLRRPHPPVIVAGTGERRTLRLVAEYADACGLRPGPDISAKLGVLRRHCDDVGRDFDAIEKTCVFLFDVGPDGEGADRLVEQLRALAATGIQHVYGRVPQQHLIAPIEAIGAQVIPAVADL